MVAYSWGIGSLNNQIQTQVRRLFQLIPSTTFGYSSSSLAEDEYIAFESDSYTEAIRIKYEDFCNYARPLVTEFSQPR